MIKRFVKRFRERENEISERFSKKHPGNYMDVVKAVIETLSRGEKDGWPDPKIIHEIDDGDYQGTLLYVIPKIGYQPSIYWYIKIGYGSCSACDELHHIRNYSSDKPTAAQIHDYMTLALRIVQGLKLMD